MRRLSRSVTLPVTVVTALLPVCNDACHGRDCSLSRSVTMAVTVVTVLFRTVTLKNDMLRPLCDGVTVVTVLTSANSTRGGGGYGMEKRERTGREKKVGVTTVTNVTTVTARSEDSDLGCDCTQSYRHHRHAYRHTNVTHRHGTIEVSDL